MINTPPSLSGPSAEASQYSESFPLPEEESGGGFTVLQIWYMVRAHLWLSIGICALSLGLAFVAIKRIPKTYEATAVLIVNTDNIDPLANRYNPIGQGNFFATQIELIYNDVMMQPVIDRLNLKGDREFVGEKPIEDPKALNDMLLERLRNAVRVTPGNGSQLLYISASARDPGQAAKIANAVSDEYMRQTKQRVNAPALERADRYNDQLAELKKKSDEEQAKVAQFRARYGITDAGGGGDVETATVSDLQTKLLLAQNARRQLEGRSSDSRADGVLLQEAPDVAALRSRLDTLQAELENQRAKLGPMHPRITNMQSEIETVRAAIKSASGRQVDQARDLERKYQSDLKTAQDRLLGRREVQEQYSNLQLEARLAQDAYAQALRGLDQVQFASQGNYQDVTLIKGAEPPTRPTRSNKRKLFMMAVAATFGLAFGLPFAWELFLNRRIRCRDDLERSFRVRMLAEFGPMKPAPAAG